MQNRKFGSIFDKNFERKKGKLWWNVTKKKKGSFGERLSKIGFEQFRKGSFGWEQNQ